MTAFNFHRRFAGLVEARIKCQTIRAFRKDGREPEEYGRLQLYTGLRTKAARKLVDPDPMCALCGHVSIADFRGVRSDDGKPLCSVMAAWPLTSRSRYQDGDLRLWSETQLDGFARADGFRDFDEMLGWFSDTHGLPFDGTITRWEHALPSTSSLGAGA